MTAETDLLPLPEPNGSYTNPYDGDDLENYARANMAPLKAEIEALRAEVERLRSMTAVTMGVGSGDGTLFVHGDYDSIKAAQALVFRAERLKEALRVAEAALADIGDADRELGDDLAWCERRAAEPLPMIRALLRDREEGK